MAKPYMWSIVSWVYNGETAIGIINEFGWVVVALNYRMDGNIGPDDLWVADELYTDSDKDGETNWSAVQPASQEQVARLLERLYRYDESTRELYKGEIDQIYSYGVLEFLKHKRSHNRIKKLSNSK